MHALVERLAVEELHHDVDAAVLADVVVEDADDATMTDTVRHVALIRRPPAEDRHRGRAGSQDLQRRAVSIAVNGLVNRRRSRDGDESDELPFVMELLPHS